MKCPPGTCQMVPVDTTGIAPRCKYGCAYDDAPQQSLHGRARQANEPANTDAPQPKHLVRRGMRPDGTLPLSDDDEPAPQSASETVLGRITDYLSCGGLFNPELANHDAVRDLIIDCRTELTTAQANEPASETLGDLAHARAALYAAQATIAEHEAGNAAAMRRFVKQESEAAQLRGELAVAKGMIAACRAALIVSHGCYPGPYHKDGSEERKLYDLLQRIDAQS